jgi:hypothetical protein
MIPDEVGHLNGVEAARREEHSCVGWRRSGGEVRRDRGRKSSLEADRRRTEAGRRAGDGFQVVRDRGEDIQEISFLGLPLG